MRHIVALALICAALTLPAAAPAQQRQRARDLGLPFPGRTGRHNAITDVAGVEVGQVTLIAGAGNLVVGKGPVRTGVTAVLPRGRDGTPVHGAWFTLNGNGEMTGTTWLEESGLLAGPVMITNTHSVGTVRDAVIDYYTRRDSTLLWGLPVVAETFDGILSDINGFHVRAEHAHAALDSARGGAVREGNVGGGTGVICHSFKGGIGTASQLLDAPQGGYTVGVLVQCNYGSRGRFGVLGVPVGPEIARPAPCYPAGQRISRAWLSRIPRCEPSGAGTTPVRPEGIGSIIVVVATDAPLLPHQLKRLTKRVALGIGRMGGLGEDSSGDIFIAFSTASLAAPDSLGVRSVRTLDNERMNPLFAATVTATEEAIVNAMLAAETMTGADNLTVPALPHDRLVAAMRKYGRMR